MADEHHYSELITKWTCSQCTLDNATTADMCVACGEVRYSSGANPPAEGVVEFQPKPGSSIMSLTRSLIIKGGRELHWACPRCSWQNDEDRAYCETCQFKAMNVVESNSQYEVVDSNGTTTTSSSTVTQSIGNFLKKTFTSDTSEGGDSAMKESTAKSKLSPPSGVVADANGWTCPRCTFINHLDLLYCEQCRFTPDVPSGNGGTDHDEQQLVTEPEDYIYPISFITPTPTSKKTEGTKKTPPPRPNYQPNQPRPAAVISKQKVPPRKPPRSTSVDLPNKPIKPARPPSPKIRVTEVSVPSPKSIKPRPPPLKQTKQTSLPTDVNYISPVPIPRSQFSPVSPSSAVMDPKSPGCHSPKSPLRNMHSPKITPRTRHGSPLPPHPRVSPPISPRVPRPRTSPKPRSNVSPVENRIPNKNSPPIKPKPPISKQSSTNSTTISSTSFPDTKTSLTSNDLSTNDINRKPQQPLTSNNDRGGPTPHHEEVRYPRSPPRRSSSITVEELKQHEESRALALWHNIVEEHKGSRNSFIDPEFPHSGKSLYLVPHKPLSRYQVSKWVRPHNVKNVGSWGGKWSVMSNPMMSDIAQGVLGNCWFLSALAVVAECPGVIEHIMVTKELCPEGVYQVRLCQDGEWHIFLVDDFFPVTSYGELVFSKACRKQLWVPLIEKALAKMYGCYEALEGGQVIEGLQALTGYPCEKFRLRGDNNFDHTATDFEYLWTRLLSFKEARYPMAACTISDDLMLEEFQTGQGQLKSGHAYSILDFKQEGSNRMIQVRDPWGHNGHVTTTSLWTTTTRPRGDGTFWIGVWEFYKFFREVDICHYIPDWHCTRTRVTLPMYASSHQLVLQFHVFDETELTISISQPSGRMLSNRVYSDLSLMLVRLPPDLPNYTSSESLPHPVECVAVSQCHQLPCVTLRTFVSPGSYAIIPLSFKNWYNTNPSSPSNSSTSDHTCVMAVFSSKVIECNENVPTIPGFVRESLFLCAMKFGFTEQEPSSTGIGLLSLHILPSLYIVLCENTNDTAHCTITCDCHRSNNVCSSRSCLISHDVIPPRHKQILMVLSHVDYSKPFVFQLQFNFRTTLTNALIGGWGSSNDPPLDKINSELHQAYPVTQNKSKGGGRIRRGGGVNPAHSTNPESSECRVA